MSNNNTDVKTEQSEAETIDVRTAMETHRKEARANKRYAAVKDQKTHFIGIHLGAGTHSLKSKDAYKTLCKSACDTGIRILKKGGTAFDAVTAATVILENSGLVNAGKGSNLTMDKTVECDAGFMNGDGCFGGVGAVEGVPNPILIAQKLSQHQDPDFTLSCGRIPPIFLVGDGARKWGISQEVPTCDPAALVSKRALKRHAKYMKRIAEASKAETLKLLSRGVSDTVGVIALDHTNKVAASVSSGGNWLKLPGRIGHSPQFGAGCWALNRGPMSDASVAISTTGVGEMLSKVQWAAHCGNSLQNPKFYTPVEAISTAIKDNFLESPLLSTRKEDKVVGMIGLIWDGHKGEFIWGHSSQSLVLAYGGSGFPRVKTIFSNSSAKPGTESVKVEAMTF